MKQKEEIPTQRRTSSKFPIGGGAEEDPSTEEYRGEEPTPEEREKLIKEFLETYEEAPFISRLFAFALDHALISLVLSVAAMIVALSALKVTLIIQTLFAVLFLLCYGLYFVVFESAAILATPGKFAFGLVTVHGAELRRLTFREAVKRAVCRVVALLPFGLGGFAALLHNERKTLHDIASNTLVLSEKKVVSSRKIIGVAVTICLLLAQWLLWGELYSRNSVNKIVRQTVSGSYPTHELSTAHVDRAPITDSLPTTTISTSRSLELEKEAAKAIKEIHPETQEEAVTPEDELAFAIAANKKLQFKEVVSLLDTENAKISVLFFDQKLSAEERARLTIRDSSESLQKRAADLALYLQFEKDGLPLSIENLKYFKVVFFQKKEGFTFTVKAPQIEFIRVKGSWENQDTVSIPAAILPNTVFNGVFIGEGKDPRLPLNFNFSWQLIFKSKLKKLESVE